MQPTEIGRSYDILAQKWQEKTPSTYGIAQFERALKFTKRIIDLLLKHGFKIEGIDISEKMIALAKELHPEIPFTHADICTWTLPRQYDFICAWDSIWHLPLDQQEPVMRKLCAGLAPSGVLLFTTAGLDVPGDLTNFDMGPKAHYSQLGIPKMLELLTQLGCVCRHLEYDQYPELHLYVIAQKKT